MVVTRVGRTAVLAVALAVLAAGCDASSAAPPSTAPTIDADRVDRPADGAGTTSPATDVDVVPPPIGPTPTAAADLAAVPVALAGDPSTTPVEPASDPLAALDPLLDDGGTLPLTSALALVAGGYRPLPGVTAVAAVDDGGAGLRTVVAHLDELSDEQRDAVLAIVDLPGLSPEEAAEATGVLADAAGLVTLTERHFVDLLRTELPSGVRITLLALPYANSDGTHNFPAPTTRATSIAWSSSDERYDECRIRINGDATAAGELSPEFSSAIAREVFHCFQFAQRPNGLDVPLWAFDGAAAFAGEEFDQGSTLSTPWWTRWINQPERPLERRTFDAIGFFALVDRSGADAYALATALLADASPDSIRRRLDGSGLFDRWGSQYANEPAWNRQGQAPIYSIAGLDLTHQDPTLAAMRPQAQPLTLTIDGPSVRARGLTSGGAMSATPYRIAVPAGVLVVTSGAGTHGQLRWTDPSGTELTLNEGTAAYCLVPGGCPCPNVPAEQTGAQVIAGASELFLGVGPFSGEGPELALKSLDLWCQQTLLPAPPLGTLDACLVRDWTATGYQLSPTSGLDTEVTGGDGATLRFNADGTVDVDLTDTSPVMIETRDADGVVTVTTLTYRGQGTGRWGAAGGVVVIGEVPTDSFSLQVTIDRPGAGRLADTTIRPGDVRLAAYANVIGLSQYQCTDVALTLTSVTPAVGGTAGFTLN